jgi:four helix bundle protein
MYVFETLDIYNKAVGFASVVELAGESFPASTDYFTDRLNRAAIAIRFNVAEAHGHWKDQERIGFFWKAREATNECSGLLDIAARQGLIGEGLKLSFRKRLDSLQKLILEAIRAAEKKDSETPPEVARPFGLRVV